MKDEFESDSKLSSLPPKDEFSETEFYNPVGERRSWSAWMEDKKIRRLRGFIHGDALVRTEISLIFGVSGSGKSYFATYIGTCIANGYKLHRLQTRQGRVLYLSQEMPSSIVRERGLLMFSKETADAMHDQFDVEVQVNLNFSKRMAESQKMLEKEIVSGRAELVFIDSLADVAQGADENSNKEMGEVMRGIRQVARDTGAHISIIHHKGKVGQDGIDRGARGASVIRDVCSELIEVKNVGKDGEPISKISFVKTRHVIGRALPSFTFEQHEDRSRMVDVSDELDEKPIMKPGMMFTVADFLAHLPPKERLLQKLLDVLTELGAETKDRWVTKEALTIRLAKDRIRKGYILEAAQKAYGMGLLEIDDAMGLRAC